MNRRDLLKTGLTLAGTSLLASNASASLLSQPEVNSNTLVTAAPGRRKVSVR